MGLKGTDGTFTFCSIENKQEQAGTSRNKQEQAGTDGTFPKVNAISSRLMKS
jgi:hypothetical protein